MDKKQSTILQISVTGLMAALVLISSMFQISIPLPVGPDTRLHLGNVFCLLSGFLLGPVRGGLAAGIGSFFFDVLNPMHLAGAPFTFLFKFLMAFTCGKISGISQHPGKNIGFLFLAAAAGSLTYLVLYLFKGFVENMLLGMEFAPAMAIVWTKFVVSGSNAVIAVIASVPLCIVIRKSLNRSHLLQKFS